MKHLLFLILVIAVAGCARPNGPTDATPESASQTTVDQTSFEIRHNPAPCDCPPFEILVGDHWIRVFVDIEESPELASLRNGDPLATATIEGKLTERERPAENGVEYRVLRPR